MRDRVRRDAAGIGVAVAAYGLSFGAAGTAAGLSVPQTAALSLLTFTGASQFALVGVLGAGGAVVSALATAWLLGVRNLFYAVRLGPLLPATEPRRSLAAQLVIDETTAMATAGADPVVGRRAFWATGVAVYTCWNLSTLAGALLAAAVPDPRTYGLDAAFPAAFLALLAPRLREPAGRVSALVGGAVALLLAPFTPPGVPVLAAVVGVLPGLLVTARRPR